MATTKRRRNRPDLENFGHEFAEPGDNTRYLRLARVGVNLPPIDISDPKQVENRINEYFDFCEKNDLKPNIKSLGNWIGVDDTTVISWRKGEYRAETHSQLIKKAVDVIQALWWSYGQDGKVNPASWIFIGKNAFGMRDAQEITVTPKRPLEDGLDGAEIERQFDALPEFQSGGKLAGAGRDVVRALASGAEGSTAELVPVDTAGAEIIPSK